MTLSTNPKKDEICLNCLCFGHAILLPNMHVFIDLKNFFMFSSSFLYLYSFIFFVTELYFDSRKVIFFADRQMPFSK